MSIQNNVLITVVIPTYNREKTIKYCLDSVLNQSYSNFEVVVVDDQSTDKTCKIVEKLSKKDARIKLIQLNRNSGAQFARNMGIENAKGEWVAFLDSDDTWKHDKLSKQIKVLQSHDFDRKILVHSNCEVCDCANKVTKVWKLPLMQGFTYKKLLTSSGPMFQSMLVSKWALQEVGYLDESIISYQEWDTSLRLAKICFFVHMHEPTFTYYLHDGDTISKNKNKDIKGYLNIVNKYEAEIISLGYDVWDVHIATILQKALSYKLYDEITGIIHLFRNTKRKKYIGKIWFLTKKNPIMLKTYIQLIRQYQLKIILSNLDFRVGK